MNSKVTPEAVKQSHTADKLRYTITSMDAMAQGALGEIASLAGLALLAMQQPTAYSIMSELANMLSVIRDKAATADNSINSAAEEVGCNYVDPAQRKRQEAARKSREMMAEFLEGANQ